MATTVHVFGHKRIDNSRLVRQRDPGYVREWAGLLAGAAFCLSVVLVCAWQQFEYVQTGYRLEELRERHEQVLEWNRALRLEHASLTDPMRIDAWARNRLGLQNPGADQFLQVYPQGRTTPAPEWARAVVSPGKTRQASAAD